MVLVMVVWSIFKNIWIKIFLLYDILYPWRLCQIHLKMTISSLLHILDILIKFCSCFSLVQDYFLETLLKRGTILNAGDFLRLNQLYFEGSFSQLTHTVFFRSYPPTPSWLLLQRLRELKKTLLEPDYLYI